ncbi:MAG TPA: Ger(x)C family spore germination protein [Clostridia bacterium]
MIKVRNVLLLLIIFNLIVSSGCWDIREINELGLVTAVGIDKAEGENRYSVTVQIANPSTENTSDSKASAKSTIWIGTEEGASIFDATRKLVRVSSRRIMWAHNNVVIIGESLAKEGIIPVIDYFTHNPELRMKASVVIAKGDARDYITAKAGMQQPSGVSFVSIESFRSISGESVRSQMLEVSAALRNEYGNPLISEVYKEKAAMQPDSQSGSDKKYSETIDLKGCAIFKKDKMLGSLSPQDTRGIAWILNQTENTVVTVFDPDHENKSVAVETKGIKSKMKSDIIDGIPRISIQISGYGNVVEEDASSSKKDVSEVKKNIEVLINKKIGEEIKNSLEIVQKKYMVDCVGFAAIVHAQNKSEWNSGLKDRWEDVFPKVPVTVSVDIDIRTSTLNQEPMKVY